MIFGLDFLKEAKAIVSRIKYNLKDAKSHQESYANKRRAPKGIANEGREEIFDEGKVGTLLHCTISHT
jgi:hypothetical protein